jgi:hypothetical protein
MHAGAGGEINWFPFAGGSEAAFAVVGGATV